MRTTVQIDAELSISKLPALYALCPACTTDSPYFRLELDSTDPRLEAIRKCLIEAGRTQWPRQTRYDHRTQFAETHIREYDASDLAEAEYLELFPDICDDTISDVGRDAQGRMMLRRQAVRSKLDFGRGVVGAILVPERVKKLLEGQT